MDNLNQLKQFKQMAEQAIDLSSDLESLENIRLEYLGKKGIITAQLKTLGQLSHEDRKTMGQEINQIKGFIQKLIIDKQNILKAEALNQKLQSESIDVSLNGVGQNLGALHPVTLALDRICLFFENIGFDRASGPEIEDNFHNFTALNIPEHHPARAGHDTFYFSGDRLLRTHTSGVQIRVMESESGPYRIIAPGRVYRCDSDMTHTPMFHQVEGLWVEQNITFSHLKGLLNQFLEFFFERQVKTRFRPSYFPFTEPSVEIDVECVNCIDQKNQKDHKNIDCRVCKNTRWLEVLGAGMVHPNVFKSINKDPENLQGLAFGLGVERLAMLKYGISDIRVLYDNDVRFLEQFTGR